MASQLKGMIDVIYAQLSGDGTLSALVGTRVYPVQADQGAARPFVVSQIIDAPPVNKLNGNTSTTNARVQITAWADTFASLEAVGNAIKGVMQSIAVAASGGNPAVNNALLMSEDDTAEPYPGRNKPIFGRRQDYSVWIST